MGKLRKGRPGLLLGEVAAPGQASESNYWCFGLCPWCPSPHLEVRSHLVVGHLILPMIFLSQILLPSFVGGEALRYCWFSEVV